MGAPVEGEPGETESAVIDASEREALVKADAAEEEDEEEEEGREATEEDGACQIHLDCGVEKGWEERTYRVNRPSLPTAVRSPRRAGPRGRRCTHFSAWIVRNVRGLGR